MTLPRVNDEITVRVGSARAARIAVVDNTRQIVSLYDDQGDRHLGGEIQLPLNWVENSITTSGDANPYEGIGLPYGYLPPFDSPNGLVIPHRDQEGSVRLYRLNNGEITHDTTIAIGEGVFALERNLWRFAGCYYTDPRTGAQRFLAITVNPNLVRNPAVNTSPNIITSAFSAASHTDISSRTAISFPSAKAPAEDGVPTTWRNSRSCYIRRSNRRDYHYSAAIGLLPVLPLDIMGIASIAQVGTVGQDVVFAVSAYCYKSVGHPWALPNVTGRIWNADDLTSGVAVPGLILTGGGRISFTTRPSLLLFRLNTQTNAIAFENCDISQQYPSAVVGNAFGNYAFMTSAQAIAGSAGQRNIDGRQFWRVEVANGRVVLKSGQYNEHEFSDYDPAAAPVNYSSPDETIRLLHDHSSDSVYAAAFNGAAEKPLVFRMLVTELFSSGDSSAFTERNSINGSPQSERRVYGNYGFQADVVGEGFERLDTNWTFTIAGEEYVCSSFTQTADEKITARFVRDFRRR